MKQAAKIQQDKLAEKQENANIALNMISSTMKSTNIHKEKIEVLKQRTEQESMQLTKRYLLVFQPYTSDYYTDVGYK